MRTASIRCQAAGCRLQQVQKRHSIRNTYPEPETEKERSSVDFPQVLPCAAQERSAFHHHMISLSILDHIFLLLNIFPVYRSG